MSKESFIDLVQTEDYYQFHKIPFIIWKKGGLKKEVKHLTSSADMFPTLASLFGLEVLSNLCYGKVVINEQSHVLYADCSI